VISTENLRQELFRWR